MAWRKAVCLTMVSLALAVPAHAQWKWKDAKGQVHVSDLPPPRDVPAKDILSQPSVAVVRPAAPAAAPATNGAASAAAAPAAKAKVDPELEAKRKAADQDKVTKARAEEDKLAAQRAENCQRARDHLATLDSGVRVVRMNAKGEREYLDDKARADEAARARQVMSQDCR